MCLDMFLQVLRSLESLAAEFTLVRFERNMYADMGGDVVSLDSRGSALTPSAGQVEVICRLSADMSLADVLLDDNVSCGLKSSESQVLT